MRLFLSAMICSLALPVVAAPPQTVRVDLQHGGDAGTEH